MGTRVYRILQVNARTSNLMSLIFDKWTHRDQGLGEVFPLERENE